MKSITVVFPRSAYLSGDSGGAVLYSHDTALCEVLGAAKSIRVQLFGYARFNSKATITAWETSMPTGRPSEVGKQIGLTGAADLVVLRPALFNVPGPFAGRVELLLAVAETTGGVQVSFDLEIVATLILEE